MTTEQDNVDNVIDEVQAELDIEQGLSTTTEDTLSIAQVQALLENQKNEFQKELNATRSHADRAVNAVRRDYESSVGQMVDDKLSVLQQQQGRQAWWSNLSQEEQELVGPLVQQLETLEQQGGQPAQPAQQGAPQSQPYEEQMQQVHQIVRSFGVDPQDQGIRYDILSDPNMTPQQRQDAFLRNLGDIKSQGVGGSGQQPQQSGQQQPPPVQQNGVNPPIEQGGQATGTLRTPDDVRDAFITGSISTDQYRERMNALGQPI
jgi:hypothetical protein